MINIDNYIGENLFAKFGDKVERRDYYKLETQKDYLKGKGERNGIMYIVDVDYNHYIDVNIYKSGLVNMRYRMDDFNLISISIKDNVEDYLHAFLSLIDEQQTFKMRCQQLSDGRIPQDLIRSKKINSVLND